MDPTQSFISEFKGFVEDLTTPEKRNIVALTEIAREALNTQPQAAPGLATVIVDRIIEAPPQLKLPALYLLDSISKLVGEPYKAYFGVSLPRAFGSAWVGGSSRAALQKLLATWQAVFPERILAAIRSEIEPAQPQYAPAQYQPWSRPPNVGSMYGAESHNGYAAPVVDYPSQERSSFYGAADGRYQNVGTRHWTPPPGVVTGVVPSGPEQHAASGALPLPDLLSSLAAAGFLAKSQQESVQAQERPPTTTFSPDSIKSNNPAAVRRLLDRTTATKANFLDLQFLRRARKSGDGTGTSLQLSRLWYVDVDTWLLSAQEANTEAAQEAGQGHDATGAAAEDPLLKRYGPCPSVPVDEDQPNCALSGEAFEQIWDEERQEWRYAGAVKLDEEDAERHGVPPGSIVLVSALGSASGPRAPGAAIIKQDAGIKGDEDSKRDDGAKSSGIKREASPHADDDLKRIKLE